MANAADDHLRAAPDTTVFTSRDAAREARDQRSESIALNNLGRALVEVRRFEEAITTCRNAAAIAQELGYRHGEAMALMSLGIALEEMQQVEEAITTLRAAAAIARDTAAGQSYPIGVDVCVRRVFVVGDTPGGIPCGIFRGPDASRHGRP